MYGRKDVDSSNEWASILKELGSHEASIHLRGGGLEVSPLCAYS